MHAELMDFNNMLQQSLCQKDALLERLRTELELLRGPMPSDQLTSEEGLGSVNVWIPSAFLTGKDILKSLVFPQLNENKPKQLYNAFQ